MKTLKRLGAVLAIYIGFVVVFETGYLGLYQPSFAESGIPMLLLTTTDADGKADSRMLARFETNGKFMSLRIIGLVAGTIAHAVILRLQHA